MVDPEQFKSKIRELIYQDHEIEFLGKNFDKIVGLLTDIKTEKIYQWIQKVLEEEIQPILIGSKRLYKDWTINQLLIFRYPLNVNNTEYRIMFVKIKNSFYVEFHLGDHNYYDSVRKQLDLKKTQH